MSEFGGFILLNAKHQMTQHAQFMTTATSSSTSAKVLLYWNILVFKMLKLDTVSF